MINILALTDFSNDAYNAIFYAVQLFKSEQCTFHILNTYDEHTPLIEPNRRKGRKLFELLAIESEEKLEHCRHRIMLDTDKNPLHAYKTISNNCDLLDCLVTIIHNDKIDFVVMGNKGKTGAKDIFFGGNTVRTIKTIKSCPLLCIPKEVDFQQPKRIVFATNYKEKYTTSIIENITKILSLTNASMHILHLNKGKSLQENQIGNKGVLFKSVENFETHEHQLSYKNTKAKTINKFIGNEGMDMLVMVRYPHNLLKKMLREAVIFDISFYLNIPFIIIPYQE